MAKPKKSSKTDKIQINQTQVYSPHLIEKMRVFRDSFYGDYYHDKSSIGIRLDAPPWVTAVIEMVLNSKKRPGMIMTYFLMRVCYEIYPEPQRYKPEDDLKVRNIGADAIYLYPSTNEVATWMEEEPSSFDFITQAMNDPSLEGEESAYVMASAYRNHYISIAVKLIDLLIQIEVSESDTK